MRALITGVTGQDGGYLADQLTSEGSEVHGLVQADDQQVASLVRRCPSITLHLADLRDDDRLRAAVQEAKPDEIYHLAGVSSVGFSWEQPILTADVTGIGTARLIEHARRLQDSSGGQVRFVQAASAEIFAPTDHLQDETTQIMPSSPYGAAKAYAHHLVQVYRGIGLHAVSMMLFNHESPRRPPSFVSRKISQTVARISSGLETHLTLGNVEAERDWGWAPDYVDAMVRACRADKPEDFVIATGVVHSVMDFALAAFAHAGIADGESRIEIDPTLGRPRDAKTMAGDASKARSILGWQPTTSFDDLVGRMVEADLSAIAALAR